MRREYLVRAVGTLLSRFHRTFKMRWNHRPYNYLFFFSYSTYTKDEADDDNNKSCNQ